MYKCVFLHIGIFSLPRPSIFSRARLRGTQGARSSTTAQVWALTEVRGTCSGGAKSQKLASNHGEAFRGRRAIQAHANPNTWHRLNKCPTGCACRSEFCSRLAFIARPPRACARVHSRLPVFLARSTVHTAYLRLTGCTRSSFLCGTPCVMGMITWNPLMDTGAISTAALKICAAEFVSRREGMLRLQL